MGRFGDCLILVAALVACKPQNVPEQIDPTPQEVCDGTIVFETDSDEWRVQTFKQHLLYSDAVAIELPAPWVVPTREDAQVLKNLTYGDGSERFITSDGYTFGMPSATVSKAGTKTKYSVLGLWRRQTTYFVPF